MFYLISFIFLWGDSTADLFSVRKLKLFERCFLAKMSKVRFLFSIFYLIFLVSNLTPILHSLLSSFKFKSDCKRLVDHFLTHPKKKEGLKSIISNLDTSSVNDFPDYYSSCFRKKNEYNFFKFCCIETLMKELWFLYFENSGSYDSNI